MLDRMRRIKVKPAYLAAGAAAVLLLGLALGASVLRQSDVVENATEGIPEEVAQAQEEAQASTGFSVADTGGIDDALSEDKSVYAEDDPDSIVYFYVTVRYGSEGKGTNHTFNEVNNAIRFVDDAHVANDVYAEALVQVGTEDGPQPGMLGYGETESNATIRIRGNSSTLMPQKNYKLALDNEAGTWRGQSNIALNKHPFDATRMRNKLYFDLAKNLPDVSSCRTQFARVFIKDETSGATSFEDYGLFTQVEVPTKKYLANHGLDRAGYLYKVISFNWEPNDLIKNFDDEDFDQAAMDTVISCRGREDNTRLMETIEAVNDTSRDINDVLDTYFDRDNYFQWLAFNLLMGNRDTTMQNYYLYSPLNGSKWYIIPWDGDTSLMRTEQLAEGGDPVPDWGWGVSNYWGVMLHQRVLKNDRCREELRQTIEEMHEWLNKDAVDELCASYYQTVSPYIYSMPDYLNLQHNQAEVEQFIAAMGTEVEENYQSAIASLSKPMPFWLYDAEVSSGEVHLSWEAAYDFEGAPFTYEITVSRYPDMSSPLYHEAGLIVTEVSIPADTLGSGTLYWKVTATRADGQTVDAMNQISANDEYYPGTYSFTLS